MKGARCSQVPSVRTVRWKLRAAGLVRGKGVENGDGEEPVPGGGVGKGVDRGFMEKWEDFSQCFILCKV